MGSNPGRVAVVAGGTGGIGQAVSRALAGDGVDIGSCHLDGRFKCRQELIDLDLSPWRYPAVGTRPFFEQNGIGDLRHGLLFSDSGRILGNGHRGQERGRNDQQNAGSGNLPEHGGGWPQKIETTKSGIDSLARRLAGRQPASNEHQPGSALTKYSAR